ncbi:lectin-like protein, partial [Flavobacteriales bacterium]|nr:lectin-like protein [Flavobacteriales bacterium]
DTTICANTTFILDAGSGFNYSWSDKTTNQIFPVINTGDYDVTVTDGNGCKDSDTITVTISSPLILNFDSDSVSCNDGSDGTATVTVTGGTPNYTYLWNDILAQTTATATNLVAGTYSLTVTDNNNCNATGSITVEEPTLLTATTQEPPQFADFTFAGEYNNQFIYYHADSLSWTDSRQKAQSIGGDLIIIHNSVDQSFFETIIPSNGWIGLYQDVNDPNYSEPAGGWKWIDGTDAIYTNWRANRPDNLGGEEYGHFSANHEWNDWPNLGGFDNLAPFAMAIDKSIASNSLVSCNGGNDGQTYVTAAGGTLPYSYAWDNGQTTDTAYNLAPGNYIVTVTDDNGCIANDTASISEPDLITGIDSITACDTYTWIDGITYTASNNTVSAPTTIADNPNSLFVSNLNPNWHLYNLAFFDSANYYNNSNSLTLVGAASQAAQTFTINVTSLPAGGANWRIMKQNPTLGYSFVPGSGSQGQPLVLGLNTLTAPASTWDRTVKAQFNNNTFEFDGITVNGNSVYGNTSSNPITYTLTNSTGCDSVVTLDLTINNSPSFSLANTSTQDSVCLGQSTVIYPSLGFNSTNPNYSFKWTPNTGLSSDSVHAPIVNINVSTIFTLTVTDSNECLSSDSIQIFVLPIPALDAGADKNICIGDSTTLNISGNDTYSWDQGVTNGVSFAPSTTKDYEVTALNQFGCFNKDTIKITVNDLPILNLSPDTIVTCNVDSILVDAGSGYNFYAWSNGQNTQQIYVANSGTYSVTVTDANGCTALDDVLVDILNVDIVQNDTSICEGESITLDATSNIPAFNPTQTMHLVPSEYATIQLAIDAATNGDTIYVSNG